MGANIKAKLYKKIAQEKRCQKLNFKKGDGDKSSAQYNFIHLYVSGSSSWNISSYKVRQKFSLFTWIKKIKGYNTDEVAFKCGYEITLKSWLKLFLSHMSHHAPGSSWSHSASTTVYALVSHYCATNYPNN